MCFFVEEHYRSVMLADNAEFLFSQGKIHNF